MARKAKQITKKAVSHPSSSLTSRKLIDDLNNQGQQIDVPGNLAIVNGIVSNDVNHLKRQCKLYLQDGLILRGSADNRLPRLKRWTLHIWKVTLILLQQIIWILSLTIFPH